MKTGQKDGKETERKIRRGNSKEGHQKENMQVVKSESISLKSLNKFTVTCIQTTFFSDI